MTSIDAKAIQFEFEFVKELQQKELENDTHYNLSLLVVAGIVAAASVIGLYKFCDYLDIPEKINPYLTQLKDSIMSNCF